MDPSAEPPPPLRFYDTNSNDDSRVEWEQYSKDRRLAQAVSQYVGEGRKPPSAGMAAYERVYSEALAQALARKQHGGVGAYCAQQSMASNKQGHRNGVLSLIARYWAVRAAAWGARAAGAGGDERCRHAPPP
jgi:hypothetical protein